MSTPPLSAGILAGITRGLVFLCAAEEGLQIHERDCPSEHLPTADEVFLTSTLRDVAPVSHVDGIPIGDGSTGPLTRRLSEAFAAFCKRKVEEDDGPAFDAVMGGD